MYLGERKRQEWIYKHSAAFEFILKSACKTKEGIKIVERRLKRLQRDIKRYE